MLTLLLLWVVLLAALIAVAIGGRRGGGALTLCYFLGLSLIHVPGALAASDPMSGVSNRGQTELGFEITIVGMAAFVAGAIIARFTDKMGGASEMPSISGLATIERVGWRLAAIGALSYFFLLPIASLVPSAASAVSALSSLLVLGLWLCIYAASISGNSRRLIKALGLLPFLPLATLAVNGFLGYGVIWVICILTFLFIMSRRRTLFFIAAPFVVYFGLSLFVTYMGERTGIRESVWYEQAGTFDRLDRISKIATNFQLLDLNDLNHLETLNGRLNQNLLVGMLVERHQDGIIDLAYGGTLPFWVLIPRFIWPDKPAVGGGGDIVTEYTGMSIAAGTSVGTGQPFEFYLNFGWFGVIGGFFVFGLLLLRLDRGIMRAIASADFARTIRLAVPGLTLLQPGGNLTELVVATVASVVVAYFLSRAGGWLYGHTLHAVP
jgi:hypothetical protein